jgi:hypothetical protein
MSQDRPAEMVAPSANTARFIKFYPNPATTFINIEFQRGLLKSSSFQVYNFLGKKIIEMQPDNGKNRGRGATGLAGIISDDAVR